MYSIHLPLIYQEQPLESTDKPFADRRWTTSLQGYCWEAKRLSCCIIQNVKTTPYTWAATINIEVEQTPEVARKTWDNIARNLRRLGIVGLWVREASRSNRIHYHLIIKSSHTRRDLLQLLHRATQNIPARIHADTIRNLVHYARYIVKAKVVGTINGKTTADIYKPKRLLFKPNLGLRKHGTIGEFWTQSVDAIWRGIIETEQRISENLLEPDLQLLVEHVVELLPSVQVKHIARQLGNHYHVETIQRWIQLLKSKNPSNDES